MLYEYCCKFCNRITEELRSLKDRYDCPPCEFCGGETVKLISVPQRAYGLKAQNELFPMVNWNLPGCKEVINGKVVRTPVVFNSSEERKQYYKRHGLTDFVTPPGESWTMYSDDASGIQDKDLNASEIEGCKFFNPVDIPKEWTVDKDNG